MSIRPKMLLAVATLTLVCCVGAGGTLSATAATPTCGPHCISIFSKELGTNKQPAVVEDVLDGAATVDQPVILKPVSGLDTSQDFIPTGGHLVSDFYKSGMVSAEVNSHYGSLKAAQIEFAPEGKLTGFCVGLAKVAFQNEELTLRPCSVAALTVWIIDTADSPATAAAGYFPIVNASTTDFSRPFAMDLPQNEVANHETLQIHVSQLEFSVSDKTLPDRQLWGAHFGVLTP